MSLRRKLIVGFSIAIISSLLLVSIISMFIINDRFQTYLEIEQVNRFKSISDEISSIYINNNYSMRGFNFERTASREGVEITVLNENGNTEYSSGTPRMRGMGRGMMQNAISSDILKTIHFDILDNGKKVGEVIIGYYNYSYITESASVFFNTLQRSIVLSGIIALLIGLIISLVLSRKISTPLVDITDTANRITKGDFKSISIKNSNITEIDQLSQSIDYLKGELINQERIRKEYAHNISHDLRTPLTTIKTYIEAIQDGIYEPNSDNLTLLKDEIDRINKLVEDLKNSYNITKEDLGLIITEYSLNEELRNIKLTYERPINNESKKLIIEVRDDIIVNLDKSRIREAIVNLLDNARKYTNPGGSIVIYAAKTNDEIIIGVKDDGIGIPEKDIPYVTERLYRTDPSRNKDTGGSGLGLSLVDTIVKAHNGKLLIESSPDKGTSVFMVFKTPPKD